MRRKCFSWSLAGFSYLGLLILLMIVGALSAATLSAGQAMQRRFIEEELLFIGNEFQGALQSYANATPPGAHPYPAQLADLLKDPRFPFTRRHLRKPYIDPMTGSGEWGIVEAPGGGILGIHSRSEEAPLKISGFPTNLSLPEGARRYSAWVFSSALTKNDLSGARLGER
mgnify:CR=1 FL=1